MATPLKSRVAIPRIRDNKIDGVKYNRSSSKRNNFEMFAWLGMRLSGVLLVVLIFGHLFVNLMVGEGIHAIDFGFVGANGIRVVIDDYAEKDRVRVWLKIILFLASAFVLLVGTLTIFTFDPCPSGAASHLLPSFCAAR